MAEREERGVMFLSSKEEQRYGRNKATVINHSFIESGDYRKKFDRISDDAELNKLLYQLAKRMLIHRSGTLFEDMYWVDPGTLQVVASETNCELEQRIIYSEATKRAIRGKTGLVTIYSHPSSFPPSLEDFNSNYGHNNSKGVVCGHDGKVYVYWAEEKVPEHEWSLAFRVLQKKYKEECELQKKTWEELMEKYEVCLKEV